VKAKEIVAEMRHVIEKLKASGQSEISCENLIQYLNGLEQSGGNGLDETKMARYNAELQNWVEQHRYANESSLEMFRSVITAGQGTIKSMLLLNGGASFAILAFIGHLAQFDPGKISLFVFPLLLVAFGVFAGGLTSGVTYLSQWFYATDDKWRQRIGFSLNIFAILLGLASYSLFGWAILEARDSFLSSF